MAPTPLGGTVFRRSRPVLVLAATACAVALVGTPAAADSTTSGQPPGPAAVITGSLDGPRQLTSSRGHLYVAESDSGQITRVDPRNGRQRTVVSGLPTPQGVAVVGGKIYAATAEADPTAEPGDVPSSAIVVARPGRPARLFADLLDHEIRRNPDRQPQFGPDGKTPLDALSNPYFLLRDRSRHGFLLVADAGANAVLKVNRRGDVSTFFVPPVVNTGACEGRPNNSPAFTGCDPVPTGLAYGPGGLLYVSALTGEAPGEGRVYVVHPRTGRIVRTISGFTAPTGVAVDQHGTVYVSELLEGAPENPASPPPGFDPRTVGQVVKVTRDGRRTYSQVTMPSGLLVKRGTLYASAWSIAGFLGRPGAGEVVRVRQIGFRPAS